MHKNLREKELKLIKKVVNKLVSNKDGLSEAYIKQDILPLLRSLSSLNPNKTHTFCVLIAEKGQEYSYSMEVITELNKISQGALKFLECEPYSSPDKAVKEGMSLVSSRCTKDIECVLERIEKTLSVDKLLALKEHNLVVLKNALTKLYESDCDAFVLMKSAMLIALINQCLYKSLKEMWGEYSNEGSLSFKEFFMTYAKLIRYCQWCAREICLGGFSKEVIPRVKEFLFIELDNTIGEIDEWIGKCGSESEEEYLVMLQVAKANSIPLIKEQISNAKPIEQ